MTTRSKPVEFAFGTSVDAEPDHLVLPQVTEYYWGYEITPREIRLDGAVMLRAVSAFAACVSALCAVLLWMPGWAWGVDVSGRSLLSVLLACLATLLVGYARRGTKVSVQIDKGAGEIRQCVTQYLGRQVVLTEFGFDTVARVELAVSRQQAGLGQVNIHLSDGRVIPAGKAAVSVLTPLKERIAQDCGLSTATDRVMPGGHRRFGVAKTA